MNAHIVKKCLIDCNFSQFFSVCNCIMDEIDKRGLPLFHRLLKILAEKRRKIKVLRQYM